MMEKVALMPAKVHPRGEGNPKRSFTVVYQRRYETGKHDGELNHPFF